MALGHYQQTAQAVSGATLLGGWQMAVAGTAATAVNAATAGLFAGFTTFASSCTLLGIGNMTGFTENIELTTTQAGNSKEPDKAVANHTATITFEMLEFYLPNLAIIRGANLDTTTNTAGTYIQGSGTCKTISTGGLTAVDKKAYAFLNTKMVAGSTVETIIVVYAAKIEVGLAWTPMGDHDTDPVMVTPITIMAELDTGRTAGDQLFIIETDLGEA